MSMTEDIGGGDEKRLCDKYSAGFLPTPSHQYHQLYQEDYHGRHATSL
jgi:hypothetical protein